LVNLKNDGHLTLDYITKCMFGCRRVNIYRIPMHFEHDFTEATNRSFGQSHSGTVTL